MQTTPRVIAARTAPKPPDAQKGKAKQATGYAAAQSPSQANDYADLRSISFTIAHNTRFAGTGTPSASPRLTTKPLR